MPSYTLPSRPAGRQAGRQYAYMTGNQCDTNPPSPLHSMLLHTSMLLQEDRSRATEVKTKIHSSCVCVNVNQQKKRAKKFLITVILYLTYCFLYILLLFLSVILNYLLFVYVKTVYIYHYVVMSTEQSFHIYEDLTEKTAINPTKNSLSATRTTTKTTDSE